MAETFNGVIAYGKYKKLAEKILDKTDDDDAGNCSGKSEDEEKKKTLLVWEQKTTVGNGKKGEREKKLSNKNRQKQAIDTEPSLVPAKCSKMLSSRYIANSFDNMIQVIKKIQSSRKKTR